MIPPVDVTGTLLKLRRSEGWRRAFRDLATRTLMKVTPGLLKSLAVYIPVITAKI